MDVPRKERRKQWKFQYVGKKVDLNGNCYMCDGGMVKKRQATCLVLLKHKMTSVLFDAEVCVRCLDNKLNVGEETVNLARKYVQIKRNESELGGMILLMDKMPELVERHEELRVAKAKLDEGKSMSPDTVKEVMTLLLIYQNDVLLRESFLYLQENPIADLMDVFAGRFGEWPTIEQRNLLEKILSANKQKNG